KAMYRRKNRDGKYLFEELMPFGGQLAEGNRWLKIKGLIPWEELEGEYAKHFSDLGRPGLDGRLVIGLFLLKHMTVLSDAGVVLELQENVYWQAFCGMEQFETGKKLDASSLTKIRHKLGPKFVRELENKTYRVLIDKKIIRGKGMLVDATVMPEKIKYPNDIGLLNDVREWTVKRIKEIAGKTGEKIRTYRRTARKLFLNFAKKKLKTRQMIERTKKQMLQYVRRNLEQLKARVVEVDYLVRKEVEERLKVAQRIYEQQKNMYDEKVQRCEERVVSFWREYVRPIKRGKSGGKEVEFGPKVCLSHVDGFTFLDKFCHENYSEARVEIVEEQIKNYEERFGRKPPSMTGDQLYGNRENRELLKAQGIRSAFKPLGRKSEESQRQEQYLRRKQRERNRIEGDIGNVKEHYGGDGIRYHYVEGSEMWVRLSLLAKNLKAAAALVA
ncbi:MAG: IS5 family transposase, partial [Chloroflexota bacterium]